MEAKIDMKGHQPQRPLMRRDPRLAALAYLINATNQHVFTGIVVAKHHVLITADCAKEFAHIPGYNGFSAKIFAVYYSIIHVEMPENYNCEPDFEYADIALLTVINLKIFECISRTQCLFSYYF